MRKACALCGAHTFVDMCGNCGGRSLVAVGGEELTGLPPGLAVWPLRSSRRADRRRPAFSRRTPRLRGV